MKEKLFRNQFLIAEKKDTSLRGDGLVDGIAVLVTGLLVFHAKMVFDKGFCDSILKITLVSSLDPADVAKLVDLSVIRTTSRTHVPTAIHAAQYVMRGCMYSFVSVALCFAYQSGLNPRMGLHSNLLFGGWWMARTSHAVQS